MPGFADSFWTPDYAGGLGVLYGKLQQGIAENQQILTIASMRAEAEEQYSMKLGEIAPAVDRITDGFARDDGASVRKAYEGVRSEMIEAAKNHQKIAANIRELVVVPFSRWCDQHEARIRHSHDDLQARIREHAKQAELVKKLRSQYFNKCRVVEDHEEENKLAFQSPDNSPKNKPPTIVLPDEQEEPAPVELGDRTYTPEELKKVLTHMLENIKLGEAKVPILGTYQNVSTGADIVEYLQKHMNATSVSYAERIGQDLVDNGFLRLVGNMGSTFANSSRMNYQWRPKVFQITGIPEKRKPARVGSGASSEDGTDSPTMSTVSEMLAGWNPLSNPYPNETPTEKMHREAREADERYKAAVRKLDQIRCKLEEEIIDNLRFMERCELDRLKAIKSVVLDFSGAIGNVIPGLQSTVDHLMLYQETIQPLGDLRYMIESYRTGGFVPKVQAYENYYGSVEDQVFGVDLEARARADRKRVPVLVTTILTYLDDHYPNLEGDEARRAIWLCDVPLSATHHLRNALNKGGVDFREVLEKYEIPIVASVLKLYLLELPDSIVSSQVYEIIKTIYSSTAHETTEEGRIKVLQSTLGQLRLNNIATLDALMTHFTRLIDLTSADEAYISALAQTLAPCILRPRVESALTMNERHSYRLIRDLFAHKEAIFGELKRQSASMALSGSGRPRAISTDESNRRAATEARNRAIADRSRANSPVPSHRHRRDRSTGGSESSSSRVPINFGSPTSRSHARQSLEVPGSSESSPALDHAHSAAHKPTFQSIESALAAPNGAGEPAVNPVVAASVPAAAEAGAGAGGAGGGRGGSNAVAGDHVGVGHNNPDDGASTPTTASAPGSSSVDIGTPTGTAVSTPTSASATAGVNIPEKRNSLTRSGGRYSRTKPHHLSRSSVASVGTGTASNRSSIAESEPREPRGVTLEDKPMDD